MQRLRLHPWQQREGAAYALTHGNNHAALAGLVDFQATVLAVFFAVLRANVTAKVCTINLNMAFKRLTSLDLLRHGLTQLVSQHKSCLVLAVQVARQLHHGHTLGGVHKDADRRQKVHKVHLAAGEDGAGGHRKLVMAVLALELAARGDAVRFAVAATRASRLAIGFRPTHFAERLVCRFLAALVDLAKAESAGRC